MAAFSRSPAGRTLSTIFDILPAASGEDSYGRWFCGMASVGSSHNRLTSPEDNAEASLLGYLIDQVRQRTKRAMPLPDSRHSCARSCRAVEFGREP